MTNQSWSIHPASFDDLPDLVDIINAHTVATGGMARFTVEQYAPEWKHSGFDPAKDALGAYLPDGRMVGLIEYWNAPPYVSTWLWGRVHPEFRGRGIGQALLAWGEQRARDSIALAPEGARVRVHAGCPSTDEATIRLLKRAGYSQIRSSFTMVRELDDLPAPHIPLGLTIRSMRPGEEAAVYRAVDESFRDHWGHVEVPFEQGFATWTERNQQSNEYDPSLFFLALDGDEIAGIALCSPPTGDFPDGGWINTVGVRRPWRRRGLAEALLYHSFGALHDRGLTLVGLGVDAQSLTGATRLYERVGMRVLRSFNEFEKELRSGVDHTTTTVDA